MCLENGNYHESCSEVDVAQRQAFTPVAVELGRIEVEDEVVAQ